jgi:AcrR family transcriptional regulator
MSPRTEKQFEIIRKEKKELIMETALELFATEGYHNVSVSDIAEAAKISKGLMYNYFGSKEELLLSIAHTGITDVTKAFDFNKDGILTRQELTLFIHMIFKTVKTNKKFWRLYFMLFLQPDVSEIVKADFLAFQDRIYQIAYSYFLEQGYEDPESELLMLSALIDGVAFQFVITGEYSNYPLNRLEEYILKKYSMDKK